MINNPAADIHFFPQIQISASAVCRTTPFAGRNNTIIDFIYRAICCTGHITHGRSSKSKIFSQLCTGTKAVRHLFGPCNLNFSGITLNSIFTDRSNLKGCFFFPFQLAEFWNVERIGRSSTYKFFLSIRTYTVNNIDKRMFPLIPVNSCLCT